MTTPTRENRTAAAAASIGKTDLVLRARLTAEQVELLKKTVAKGATDDEFALFLHSCERTGLDPFAKQIYCLKRRTLVGDTWVDVMVTQTGIDGFRLIAERTGDYRGQITPVFFDKAGNAREVWLDSRQPPVAAKVGVLKAGFAEPLFAIALYEEYVQKKQGGDPNKQWKEKPTIMLAKCAEALALRKAFPQELSGIYVHEEMPDVDPDETPSTIAATATRARIVGEAEQGARVNESGEVELTFGEHRGKPLAKIPTDWLLKNFRDPWRDDQRRTTAALRLGLGFMDTMYAELARRGVTDAITIGIAKLLARADAGEVLEGEDAETLRQWRMDHEPPAVQPSVPPDARDG